MKAWYGAALFGAVFGLLGACGPPQPDCVSEFAGATAHALIGGPPQLVYTGPTSPGVYPQQPDELFVINLDGTNKQQLTCDGHPKFLPHFSPDGSKLVYTKYAGAEAGGPNSQTDVFVFDLASGEESQITTGGTNGYGLWSPDGTQLSFLKNPAASGLSPPDRSGTALMLTSPTGGTPSMIAKPSGADDDWFWPGDSYWSWQTNQILFNVITKVNGCVRARTDKIWPDGTHRVVLDQGGTDCLLSGMMFDIPGDADPGWSPGGDVIYSSRGFERMPNPHPPNTVTLRKLFSFSTDGKDIEKDLSLPSQPDCNEGLPRASPDGTMVAQFRVCFDDRGQPVKPGVYVSNTAGTNRDFVVQGSGPDWNLAFGPANQACAADAPESYHSAIQLVANQNPPLGMTNSVSCRDLSTGQSYAANFTSYPFVLFQDPGTKALLPAGHGFKCDVQSNDGSSTSQTSWQITSPSCP